MYILKLDFEFEAMIDISFIVMINDRWTVGTKRCYSSILAADTCQSSSCF